MKLRLPKKMKEGVVTHQCPTPAPKILAFLIKNKAISMGPLLAAFTSSAQRETLLCRSSCPAAFDDDRIAVAHTTRLNVDANLFRAWVGNLQLDDFKTAAAAVTWAAFIVATAIVINSPFSAGEVDGRVTAISFRKKPALGSKSPHLVGFAKPFRCPTGITVNMTPLVRVSLYQIRLRSLPVCAG
jgi:hypothetical protein